MQQEVAKRSRRSSKQVQELIQQYEQSGLGVKQFCQMHGLSAAGFYKMRNRYQNKAKVKAKTSFIPVALTSTSTTSSRPASLFCEVKGIKIYQVVSATFLKELIQ